MTDFVHPHKLEITEILNQEFKPSHLEVIDESYKHASGPTAGSHYLVVMVSDQFGASPVINQRKVYKALSAILEEKIHALSLRLYTPQAWANKPEVFATPDCAGKHK